MILSDKRILEEIEITQELLGAIEIAQPICDLHNIMTKKDVAVENCYNMLEKHCIVFNKFINDNFYAVETQYSAYNYSKYFTDDKLVLTTKQLFNLYIEQL